MNEGLEEAKRIINVTNQNIKESNLFESEGYEGVTTAISLLTKDILLSKKIEGTITDLFKILTILESGECLEYDKYLSLFKQKYKKLLDYQIKTIKAFNNLTPKELHVLKNTILTRLRKISKHSATTNYQKAIEEISNYEDETLNSIIISCVSYTQNFGNIYQLANVEKLPDEIWEALDEVEVTKEDIDNEYKATLAKMNVARLEKRFSPNYLEKYRTSSSPKAMSLIHDKANELSMIKHNIKS